MKRIPWTKIIGVWFVCLVALFFTVPTVKAQSLSGFAFSNLGGGSGQMAGVPFEVTITALDTNGNTLNSFNESVTLTDTTGTIAPTQTSNFSNGVWRGTVSITQATASTAITAIYSTASEISDSFVVTPDTRIKFVSIVSGNNQTGAVRTQLPQALTVKVVDPFSNPLPNVGVNFAITSIPPNSQNQSLTNITMVTGADGAAGTQFILGSKAGTYIISGNLNTGVTNTVHFFETGSPGALISIAINPPVAVIPAGNWIPFTASGYDQYNNSIILNNLTWMVENGGGTIDSTGVFYAGSVLGTFMNTVKAVSAGVGSSATVSIVAAESGMASGSGLPGITEPTTAPYATPTSAAGSLSQIIIDPQVISALDGARIPITATGVDLFGNKVSGVSYTFDVEGDLGTIVQTSPNTALLTVDKTGGMGTVTVSATQGSITRTSRIAGSVGNGMNRRLIIEAIESPQTVGMPFTISIAAKDNENNFITDYEGPIVIADTTGTIDPAVVQPSEEGIWYVQAVINLAHPEVSITVAGDGMVGVSNIFEVIGEPAKSDVVGPGLAGLGGAGQALGASISAIIDTLMQDKDLNRFTIFRYIGSGIAAGFGILGASIGGGIMTSRGLEAIGRNPYAKTRLQMNLYASMITFVIAAAFAVVATFLILK